MTQIIEFRPHTWESWKAEYVPQIRVIWKKEKIKPLKIYSAIFTGFSKPIRIYLPRYRAGDWMAKGVLEEWLPGSGELIIRVPAVRIKMSFAVLILDGIHRILDLNPCALILDTIVIPEKQACYFADLKSLT